ncbi:probable methyltransferase PMT27 [Cynara cardunculus var. scolymus]|uniref:probable methyltransferase PMT27 n=1 Tax=Cynara cardunculus var. scolymus TaxID=59895 RepID=UPI000D6276BC|nr:probable methyltransferase PMT27 [Cynara cardunculus var. scolymus]
MATAKLRPSKRSSTGSHTSTVTTLVFVCICGLGLWMLTSNSYVSPNKSTTRVSDSAASELRSRKIPIDSPVFEDNPGNLPEDAIKTDDASASRNNDPTVGSNETKNTTEGNADEIGNREDIKKQDETAKEHQTDMSGSEVDKQPEVDEELIRKTEGKAGKEHQTEMPLDTEVDKHPEVDEEPKTEDIEKGKDTKQQDKAVKEHETETLGSEVGKAPRMSEVDEEPKIKTEEVQISEESTMTQNQRIEEIPMVKNTTADEDHLRGKSDHVENNEEHHITEEEQENRMEKHQQQQEESQNEETSTDQTQHDEENTNEPHPANKMEAPMEETTTITPDKDSNAAITVDERSSGIPKESHESKKGWKTQAGESNNQKERRQGRNNVAGLAADHKWELCNVTTGTEYIPCLDNENAIRKLASKSHFEHRERHCPEEGPMCLVPIPEGYKTPIPWPHSRDKIWFHNVPYKSLADIEGHQNWMRVNGEFLTFPEGGTQSNNGALHYIDVLQEAVPEIAWGKHTRVVLDVGCGVASFGGYLFDRDVLAMSFGSNDEHDAQIQFALERGIPAISAVMGTRRLPFPSKVFDLVHCAHCRVPWHKEGGMLLLELNRLLRPGGYFVWSATPVYQNHEEDVQIWEEMSALTVAMCWELLNITKDKHNSVGVAIYRKPESNECYNGRKKQEPAMCKPDDDPNAAWYIPLQACMHNSPMVDTERGSRWPEDWPGRVQTPPYWLRTSQMGIYGRPAPDDFITDYHHWKRVVSKSYMSDLGFNWADVRNVMDMRAVYGGFAAALKDLKLWVLNVVSTNSPDTLPIIFERGLFGIYHDWCESFSTYPRTYDLLHADHLFSMLKKRCKIAPVMVEVDRIVRPGGKLIVRDESSTIGEVENLLKSLHWDVHLTFSDNQEGILSAQKSTWRPTDLQHLHDPHHQSPHIQIENSNFLGSYNLGK